MYMSNLDEMLGDTEVKRQHVQHLFSYYSPSRLLVSKCSTSSYLELQSGERNGVNG